PEHPCPYCGYATMLSQRTCPQCKQSLMVRAPGGKGLRGVFGMGELQRIALTISDMDHVTHYNRGVTYKNQGMWYMAAREWEAAVKKRGSDPVYRRALGLAYAQIKEYGRSVRELRQAQRLRQDDPNIAEDLRLVEELALKE